jgi:hypothetical protein
MAAAASAPPPPTSHTMESARPAGLGGAAKAQREIRGSEQLPIACHGPLGSTRGSETSNRCKNGIFKDRRTANKDLQTLTYTHCFGVAEQKWPAGACAT